MKKWVAIAFAWIVSLFTFWTLGENNGDKKAKIETLKETEKNVAKAIDLRNNVDSNVDGVRKKWKRSKK